jgi:molecular chaperone GrpE
MSKKPEKEEEIKDNQVEDQKQSAEENPPAGAEKTPEEKLAEANDKYMRLYAEFDN